MPHPRRAVVIKKSRMAHSTKRGTKSGNAGVYVVAGVAAVGAIVYLMREKGASAPIGDDLALDRFGRSSFSHAVSSVTHAATNTVSSVASQAAAATKAAATAAAATAKKAQEVAAAVAIKTQQAALESAKAAAAQVKATELAARNVAQNAANEAALGLRMASALAVQQAQAQRLRMLSTASKIGQGVKTVRGAASDVLQSARKAVVGVLVVGAMKLHIMKAPAQPDGSGGEPNYVDDAGNPLSHAQLIDTLVLSFKAVGDADATSALTQGGINPAYINEARAKWISMGSPRDQTNTTGGGGSGGGVDRSGYIDSMIPWFKAQGEAAATSLSGQGVPPADIAEARAKWISMGSPRDPQQPQTPAPTASNEPPAWVNPYLNLNPPGSPSSGGGGGGGGGGDGGAPAAPQVSASADQVKSVRDAQVAAAAPAGKLNPLMVAGAAVATPFLMHFLGGK